MINLLYKNLLIVLSVLLVATFSRDVSALSINLTGNDDRAPKIYNSNSTPKGFLIEITKHIGKKANIKFNIKLLPLFEAVELARNSDTGIIGLFKTKEKKSDFDIGEVPLFVDEVILVCLKNSPANYKTKKNLKGKTIGVVLGANYGEEYDVLKKENLFTLKYLKDTNEQIEMLLNGKVDIILINYGVMGFDYTLKKYLGNRRGEISLFKNKFSIENKPISLSENYLAFSQKANRKKLLNQIDIELKKAWKSGVIDQIIQKSYSKD